MESVKRQEPTGKPSELEKFIYADGVAGPTIPQPPGNSVSKPPQDVKKERSSQKASGSGENSTPKKAGKRVSMGVSPTIPVKRCSLLSGSSRPTFLRVSGEDELSSDAIEEPPTRTTPTPLNEGEYIVQSFPIFFLI